LSSRSDENCCKWHFARDIDRKARLAGLFFLFCDRKEEHSLSPEIQVQGNPSIFASPLLLDEFSTALLSLDTPTLLSINIDGNIQEVMEVKDFLQGFYKSTLEKLTFYYFLLVRDSSNLVSGFYFAS
jgi:hypothetical protein